MNRLPALSLFLFSLLANAQGPPPRNPPTGKPPEKSAIKKIGGTSYEIGGILFDGASRVIRVPCAVNMTEGVIEYALVSETGKTHESLLKTKVKPFDLQIALLLCRYEPHPGELINTLVNPPPELRAMAERKMERPGANRLKISVEWKDAGGKEHSAGLTDWIHSDKDGKPMNSPWWIFNGADVGDGIFSAELDGSFISVHFDLVSLMGNPAKGIDNDQNWEIESKKVPAVDTAVTLIISPVPDDNAKK